MNQPTYLTPNWPAPAKVKAQTSLRIGGQSVGSYHSFNMATHVGDDANLVAANRERLRADLDIDRICWLDQVHGVDTLKVTSLLSEQPSCADASWTQQTDIACAVLTADCLPLLVCDSEGTRVAAIHAGWRGLLNGVISNCLDKASFAPKNTLIWLGPAIGPSVYQVGSEVRQSFLESPYFAYLDVNSAFATDVDGRFLCDLYQLAKLQLSELGYLRIYGGDQCTSTQSDKYFSYRRDGQTGRMASLIWISSE